MSSSTARVYRSLRSSFELRPSLNTQTRTMLVHSHCAAVFSSLDVRTSSMPNVALNSCIRFIVNVPRYAFVIIYRFRPGFLSSNNRRFYFALVLFFKVAVMRFPLSLFILWIFNRRQLVGAGDLRNHRNFGCQGSGIKASYIHFLIRLFRRETSCLRV